MAAGTPAEENGRREIVGGDRQAAAAALCRSTSRLREVRQGTGTSPRCVEVGRDSTGLLGSPGPETPTERASKGACWTPRERIPRGLPAWGNDGEPYGELGFQSGP